MKYFWTRRLFHRPSWYFSIGIGILITLTYTIQSVQDANSTLSAFYVWFESLTGSPLPTILWMIFPILVSLPLATIFLEDFQTGYLKNIIVLNKIKDYFNSLFCVNFVIGGVTGILPILVNFYLTIMTTRADQPNLVLDNLGNIMINSNSLTLFPEMFYAHPFVHVLFYLLIGFLVGGLLTSVTLVISLWLRHIFPALLSTFVLIFVLKLFIPFTKSQILYSIIPTSYANQVGIHHGYRFDVILVSYCLFLGISAFSYFRGIRRYEN